MAAQTINGRKRGLRPPVLHTQVTHIGAVPFHRRHITCRTEDGNDKHHQPAQSMGPESSDLI